MPFKPFRFSGFKKGLYAPASLFDQPPGTLPRIVNFLFTERGGLVTVDGTHVISRPAPPAPLLGFVSSGSIVGTAPPAPTTLAGSQAQALRMSVAGSATLSLPYPSSLKVGDVVLAVASLKIYFPGVGDSASLPSLPSGWTTFITYPSGAVGTALAAWIIGYRVIDGTEGANAIFTFSSSAVGGFKVSICAASMYPIRGANSVAPIDNVQADNGGSDSGGSYTTAHGVLTHFTNDLIFMHFELSSSGSITTPSAPVGTNLDLVFSQDLGGTIGADATIVELDADQAFAGPGTSPTYTSTGWAPSTRITDFLVALGAGFPITGELEGFLPSSNGPISPTPIIVGSSTLMSAPEGCVFDTKHQLWVADAQSGNNGAILMYKNPQSDPGNVAPDAAIQGTLTFLRNPADVFVDINGKIYVANSNGPNIQIFNSGANGNVGPALSISGSNTGLVKPLGVAVDSVGNVYVLDTAVNSIYIWNAGVVGNIAPSRTITGAATLLQNPLAIRIDPNGIVWVTCGKSGVSAGYLLGFTIGGSTNGNVAPTYQINSTGIQPPSGDGGPTGIAFDTAKNIYVAVDSQHEVQVFAYPAAPGSSTPAPIQTITGFTNGPYGIAVAQN